MECRVYAEDPDNQFFPSPGRITRLISPSGPGIRRDSGMYEGWTVPLDYDPLLAKLISYGSDREQCIGRLQRALYEYFVGGIKTNIPLFRRILSDPDFKAGKLHTGFLDRLLSEPQIPAAEHEERTRMAAIAAAIFATSEPQVTLGKPFDGVTYTVQTHGKQSNGDAANEKSKWKSQGRAEAVR
jgi:acetyl-CoA carboxylase biotin carboxylase subunit